MFDFDDSVNIAYNTKMAGKNLVIAKHEILSKTGEFLFLAHSDREFVLRCQLIEADLERSALNKMANVSDSKAKLVRALYEEWKIRHANCSTCKTAHGDMEPQILEELQEIEQMMQCMCGASCKGQFNGTPQCAPGEGCAAGATPGACGQCGQSFQGHDVCSCKGGCGVQWSPTDESVANKVEDHDKWAAETNHGREGSKTAMVKEAMAHYPEGANGMQGGDEETGKAVHEFLTGPGGTDEEGTEIPSYLEELGLHNPEVQARTKGGTPVLVIHHANNEADGNDPFNARRSPTVTMGILGGKPEEGQFAHSIKGCTGVDDTYSSHLCGCKGLPHAVVIEHDTDYDNDAEGNLTAGMHVPANGEFQAAQSLMPMHNLIPLTDDAVAKYPEVFGTLRDSFMKSINDYNRQNPWKPNESDENGRVTPVMDSKGQRMSLSSWLPFKARSNSKSLTYPESPLSHILPGSVVELQPKPGMTKGDSDDRRFAITTGITPTRWQGSHHERRWIPMREQLKAVGQRWGIVPKGNTEGLTDEYGNYREHEEGEPGITLITARTPASTLRHRFLGGILTRGGQSMAVPRLANPQHIIPTVVSRREIKRVVGEPGSVDFGLDNTDELFKTLLKSPGSSNGASSSGGSGGGLRNVTIVPTRRTR